MVRSSMTLLVIAAGALVALGCKSTGSRQAEEPQALTTPQETESEFQEAEMDAGKDGMAGQGLEPVYFDLDRFDIRADARPVLEANARKILAGEGTDPLTIEGHCDERGSDEYNLALGERRAAVVKRYLVDLGVPASRLQTVSFGESRPAVKGHGEYAWSMNRRSELRTDRTSGLGHVSSR